jgi:subtilisin family serine protease
VTVRIDPTTLLVRFDPTTQPSSAVRSEGDVTVGKLPGNVAVVKLQRGESVGKKVARYKGRKDVVYAEPNYIATVSDLAVPSDPGYSSQWGLQAVHATGAWGVYPGAYASAGGSKIAILDTGIDSAHPDLATKLDTGDAASCVSGICAANTANDDHGHGTHVAGIAAALTDNGIGVAGLGINAPLLPVKVCTADGSCTVAAVAAGVYWAVNHGSRVINLSLGAYGYSATLCAAVSSAVSHGVVVVAAAGNDGVSLPSYPAACPGAIGVAATMSDDESPDWSNYGSPDVFVSAPGDAIYSTWVGSTYATEMGTSMATPFVSGLASLLLGQSSARTVADVKDIIAETARKIGASFYPPPYVYGGDPYHVCACTWHPFYGYGLIDASAALSIPPVLTTLSPTSSVTGTTVTLTGKHLETTDTVTFNGVSASITSRTPTTVKVTVPASASTGPLEITTSSGLTASRPFTVLPKITGFTPTSGVADDPISIVGTGLLDATAVKFNGVVAPVEPGGDERHVATRVPASASTGVVTVTTPAGTAASSTPFHIAPTITALSTLEGPTGTSVVVSGTSFVGVTAVKVGGVVGSYAVTSATSLKVTVPPAAVTGPVTVTTTGGTGIGPVFTVDPKVSAVAPLSGVAGSNVSLSGTGLAGATEVDFVGASAPAVIVSNTSISVVAKVPSDATNGQVTVHVGALSAQSATVFKPLPKIVGFQDEPTAAGLQVTVNGSNFTAGASPVAKLGAVVVGLDSIDATSFKFTVPDNGLTGAVAFTNANGAATSPVVVHVKPTIGSLSSSEEAAGAHIVINGKTFTGTSAVKFFNNVPAAFTVGVGGTSLNVTVPAAAATGPITVTNAGGTTTGPVFTVDPKLAGFTPTSGTVGTALTITGTGLADVTSVDFGGGVSATPNPARTATSLHVVVPPGAATGPLTVHTTSATSTSTTPFTVSFSVTGLSPTSAVYGAHVTLTGVGLTGVTQVKFNGLPGGIVSNTGTTIDATVPASGDVTGPVTVWKGTASIAAPQSFTLLTVASLGLTAGFSGNDLTITGTGLAGATSVHIGSVVAPIGSNDGTHIHVSIPDTATTGAVTVTGPGGTATGPSLTVRAGLVLNEIAPNVSSGGTNTIELYATSSGEVGGVTLVANPGSDDQVVATLPSFTVSKGELIVVHVGTAAAAPRHAGSVWDLAVTGDIAYGDVVLELKNGTTVLDAVPFVDPAVVDPPGAFLTSINSLGSQWPGCGSCNAAAAILASVDWSGVGATPTGPTAQRDFGTGAGGDTNDETDWSVHGATLAAANQ